MQTHTIISNKIENYYKNNMNKSREYIDILNGTQDNRCNEKPVFNFLRNKYKKNSYYEKQDQKVIPNNNIKNLINMFENKIQEHTQKMNQYDKYICKNEYTRRDKVVNIFEEISYERNIFYKGSYDLKKDTLKEKSLHRNESDEFLKDVDLFLSETKENLYMINKK